MTTSPPYESQPKIQPYEEHRSAPSFRRRPPRPSALSATLTHAGRAVLTLKHTAFENLFDLLMMPLMFLLIFNYLFGGAFAGSAENNLQYFVPGVLVMSAVMLTTSTGSTVSTDIGKGVFDRFRTLPFWQPAALVGTMLVDLGRYLVALLLTAGLGLLLGFRPAAGLAGLGAALLLILLFTFAVAWGFTALGLVVKQANTMHSASMPLMALVFCSDIFVSSTTMPTWMRIIVDLNPISHVSGAARGLLHGTATGGQLGLALLWSAALLALFGPLTMHLYRRKKSG